jgi:peptide/nickel transport system permease protein
MSYVARRLGHALLLVAAVSFLCFLFADLAPGNFYAELRFQRGVSNQSIAEMRSRAGLDRPLVARYALWVSSAVRGEWGYSLAYNAPVGPLLAERLRATLLLTATATFLSWLVAVPWGLWTAVQRNRWPDAVSRFIIAALLVIPDLLIALAFLAFAAASGMFPVGGMHGREYKLLSTSDKLRDLAWHLALPVAVLVLASAPVLVRHVRAAVVQFLDAPFALNTRALGIPRRRLLFRHLLPAA